MHHIAIISSSVRTGRKSHYVALYVEQYLKENQLAETDLIDLSRYDFPVFHERLQYLKDPSPDVLEYAERIKKAEGIIVVTPEYNGGYPAALKNAIDLYTLNGRENP